MTQESTRRDRNAEATRREIMQAGRELFAIQPYSDVTSTEICTRAGVTRGALQHHFGNKFGLFMAIFGTLQRDVVRHVTDACNRHSDPWVQAQAAILAFLDACTDPGYQAIVLTEAPAAVGWRRWRELNGEHFADIVHAFTDTFAAAGLIKHSPVMMVATLRGALTELSFEIARSDDQRKARAEALAVIDAIISGFRERPSSTAHWALDCRS